MSTRRPSITFFSVMALTATSITLSQPAQALEDATQIGGGVVLTGIGTAGGISTFLKMQKIYAKASLTTLATTTDVRGIQLNASEIHALLQRVHENDLVYVTYMTTEEEQRQIRLRQLQNQHDELLKQQEILRTRVDRYRNSQQGLILSDEIRDFERLIQESELEIRELERRQTSVTPHPVVREFDLQKASTRDLESYLSKRIRDGGSVLHIASRNQKKFSQFKGLRWHLGGQLAIAGLGGFILFEQLTSNLDEPSVNESLKGVRLFVPPLETQE